jgi:hypothetical protein
VWSSIWQGVTTKPAATSTPAPLAVGTTVWPEATSTIAPVAIAALTSTPDAPPSATFADE